MPLDVHKLRKTNRIIARKRRDFGRLGRFNPRFPISGPRRAENPCATRTLVRLNLEHTPTPIHVQGIKQMSNDSPYKYTFRTLSAHSNSRFPALLQINIVEYRPGKPSVRRSDRVPPSLFHLHFIIPVRQSECIQYRRVL